MTEGREIELCDRRIAISVYWQAFSFTGYESYFVQCRRPIAS
jgi:hypothetical protein